MDQFLFQFFKLLSQYQLKYGESMKWSTIIPNTKVFSEVPILIKECEQSCICMLETSCVFLIFLLDLVSDCCLMPTQQFVSYIMGTIRFWPVQTVWYFFVFHYISYLCKLLIKQMIMWIWHDKFFHTVASLRVV
jgi:hypothetical protein